MQLNQLEYFVKVVECQSMNKAAEQLFVSQPNLSKAIKALEEELKMTLLIRHSKGITLTNEGNYVYHYCKSILKQTTGLKLFSNLSKPERFATLLISTTNNLICSQALALLLQNNPQQQFNYELQEQSIEQVIEDVIHYRSELGIISYNLLMNRYFQDLMKQNGLIFTPLYQGKIQLMVSNTHPLAAYQEIDVQQIEAYPVISSAKGDMYLFDRAYHIDGYSVEYSNKQIMINTSSAQLELLRNSQACKFTGPWNKVLSEQNHLVVLDIKNNEITTSLGYIHRKSLSLSLEAKAYLDCLNELLQTL